MNTDYDVVWNGNAHAVYRGYLVSDPYPSRPAPVAADLIPASGPDGREWIIDVLPRVMGSGSWTLVQLADRSGYSVTAVARALRRLIADGCVQQAGRVQGHQGPSPMSYRWIR